MNLEDKTVEIEHRYSGKQGVWGWWVCFDQSVLEFIESDDYFPDENLLETVKNFLIINRIKHKLKLHYEKSKANNRSRVRK